LLVEKIDSGEWATGHQLPTEFELSSEFRVSRATVRQAMQLLAKQGLIERMQGRGTFVARPKISHNLLSMFTNGADIARVGTVPHIRLEIAKRSRVKRDRAAGPRGERSRVGNQALYPVR
jgi:DNA-binding GntR family transcriptional regulator